MGGCSHFTDTNEDSRELNGCQTSQLVKGRAEVHASKGAPFSDLLLPLRKPSRDTPQSACEQIVSLGWDSAAGCTDKRDGPVAMPGGLCLLRVAIHLALIGSSPAASRMSHGRLASLLSTFSPCLYLGQSVFLSVPVSETCLSVCLSVSLSLS